ncbi:hypothetical protein ABEB36_014424, partial [Hypothenemus hampei]
MSRTRRQVNYHKYSEFDRGRIMDSREAGLSFGEVATKMNRCLNIVMSCMSVDHQWFIENGRLECELFTVG